MKILAIDDNNDNLITLKAIIKDQFHEVEVISATSGKKGLLLLEEFSPDVIILDVIMPEMDGYEVCEVIRSNEETQNIPVIFLTALKENKENRLKALEAGGDVFLSKPFDEAELIAQIRAMTKLKHFNDLQKQEKATLESLVQEKTEELQRTYYATLNLLEDLREENETRKRKEKALIESETRFKMLFDQAPVGYQSLDLDGKFLDVNQTWLDMMGYQRNEVIGKYFNEFLAPPFVDPQKECFKKFKDQGSINVEFDLIKKDRSIMSVSFEGRIGYDEHGNFKQTHCVMQDITEKLKSEYARRESEKRYRSLFEDSPVSIWEEDFSKVKMRLDQLKAEGVEDFRKYLSEKPSDFLALIEMIVVTDVNQETVRLFKAENKEDLKKSIRNLYTEKSFSQFLEEILNIVDGKIAFEIEFTNKTLSGEILDFTAKWAVVPGYEEDYSKVLISMVDITDRKKAEEALRENEERYRSLFNDSPVAIYEEDFSQFKILIEEIINSGVDNFREYLLNHPDLLSRLVGSIKVTDINQQAFIMIGLNSLEEFSGRLDQVATPFVNALLIDEFVNIANGMTKFQTEINRNVGNGKYQHLNVDWAVVPGYEESLAKVIVTVVDITERKELEKRQRQRLAEMEAIDKITSALREANSKEEALPIFLHETLTMMQVEMGFILLHHPSSDVLRISDAIGVPDAMLKVEIRPGEGEIGKVFLTGEPVNASNLLQNTPDRKEIRDIHMGFGGVCVPIQTQEDILGVLVVVFPEDREVKTDDIRLLEAFARIAGITLHRMTLHEDTLVHLQQLQVQRTIDQTIASIFDLNLTLEIICSEARNYLKANAAGLLLFNPIDHTLTFAAEKGFRTHIYKSTRIPLGSGPAGKVAMSREMVHIKDLYHCDPPFKTVRLLQEENFLSYLGIPLVAKGELKGVMEIFFTTETKFEPDLLEFIHSLAFQTAIAIDNLQLFENLQRSNQELVQAYDATIEGWSRAMDLRDKETEEHTKRVTEMATKIARILGVSEEEIVHVRRGALLHDIGKMGVPDEILRKPGPLTPEEWVIMKQHPVFAYEMIAPIEYLKPALDIPYCHHEKWDGTGYPRGLKGEEIPLAGRIFAVIDVWDALSSDRPYRKAWDKERVRNYIEEQSGSHFDPEVVKIFLEVIESEDWQE